MKVQVAERIPPGDRWKMNNTVYDSLTECLNMIFLDKGVMFFEVDAQNGIVSIDDGKEAPKAPPKAWDLYGEKSG
jgi:hypothetical protein|tara:strand:+ start:425 stop:649 length:225 start_codon:yes stop_codon:yes gene_type:complete